MNGAEISNSNEILDWAFRVIFPFLFFLFGMWVNHRKETKGYIFFPPKISKIYKGRAFDIRIIKASTSVHPDFSRALPHEWEMEYIFRFTDKRLSISGTAKDQTGATYQVYGNGYIRGDAEQGQSTIILKGERKHGMENGFVVYFLKWPNPNEMNGYWVAYDKTAVGILAFGGINMQFSSASRQVEVSS